jgi:DNA polymerase-3 subunit alpha
LSAHPLAHVAGVLKRRATTSTTFLNEEWAGQRVTLGGRITEVRRIMTKRGDTMAAVQLEDMQGSIEVVVFPKVYATTVDHWHEDAVVLVTGSVKMRDEEPQLVCDSVEEFTPSDEEMNRKEYLLRIHMSRRANDALEVARVDQLLTALGRFPGEDRFELLVRNGRWQAWLAQAPGQAGVQVCPELVQRLEEILGPGAVEAVPVATAGTGAVTGAAPSARVGG